MKLVSEVGMQEVNCGECGGSYAINLLYYDQCRANSRSWTCPYCKVGWGFSNQKTRAQRLEEELRWERQKKDLAQQSANEANARARRVEKQHRTMRTRVFNGVCPCCNRTFQNLMSHMKTQHGTDKLDGKTLRAVRMSFDMTQAEVGREAGVSAGIVSRYESIGDDGRPAPGRVRTWLESQLNGEAL